MPRTGRRGQRAHGPLRRRVRRHGARQRLAAGPDRRSGAGTPSVPRNVVSTGTREVAATSPAPARSRLPGVASAGAKTATTASARSIASRTPAVKSGRPRPAPTSTVATASSPDPTQASVTSTPSALEFVTVATRDPGGSGWYASSWATSNSSVSVSTRITPDSSNSACTRSSGTGTARAASAGVARARTGRSSPRPPAWSAPPAGPAGRTCASCRSSPGRAARRRSPGRAPSTAAGRCR